MPDHVYTICMQQCNTDTGPRRLGYSDPTILSMVNEVTPDLSFEETNKAGQKFSKTLPISILHNLSINV